MRGFDRTFSVFIGLKCHKGCNGFFNGSLFGACYDSKRHKAIAAQDRITRKTCKLLVCQYDHCPRWVSPRVPSLKEESLVVITRSVDNGGMIEIHIRYHRRYSSEIVKPRPITKARQMCVQTKARQMQSKRNLVFS